MSTTEPRTIVRHDFPSADWDPFLTSLFAALLAAWPKGKRPLTIAAFVPLALCALASYMGLGHLLTEERVKAAVARACPPGPKPKDDPQTSLLDVVTWPEDGRPGVFVSLVRLKIGNVRETCGQFVLDLHGCHVPSTAAAAAVAAGWGVLPEVRGSSEGLRFLPPSVVAFYLAGNPAALARQTDTQPPNVETTARTLVQIFDEYIIQDAPETTAAIESTSEDPRPDSIILSSARTAELEREEELTDGPILTQANKEDLVEACDETTALARQNNSSMEVHSPDDVDPNDPTNEGPPRELTEHDGYTPDGHAFEPDPDAPPASHDDAAWQAEQSAHEARFEPTFEDAAAMSGMLPPGTIDMRDGFGPMATPPSDPIADLTIGDFVKLTSGPHAGRIAGICSVSGDKPEAQLVGRKVDVQDVTEVPGDAIDLIGEDPDDAPKPSQKSSKKSKSSSKRKGSKS